MSIRNLDVLFKPRSIALIGASKARASMGAVLAHNLFNSGFTGPIMPVNPKHRAIEGVLTYPDAEALPEVPDLVVIATPPDTVPGLIAEFAARGTRAAVVITAGFGEGGDAAGGDLRRAMLEAAGRYTLRIVGPNCIGVMVPSVGLNAGFAHIAPKPGHLAFVAQSGAIATSVLDWATSRGIGFSHVVSLGDMCDVDFGDMLDYLAGEGEVRGILLYIEAVTTPASSCRRCGQRRESSRWW
jgi:acetyltransferase